MKVDISDDKVIVFLGKSDLFKEKTKLKEYLKNLFTKLTNNYELEFSGYYNIDAYHDDIYGYILEITNKDMYNYFEQIDMQINILDKSTFLYEIDYPYVVNVEGTIYAYKEKTYLKLNNIDDFKLASLLEHSKIIYGNEIKKIIKYSKKVSL